MNYAKKFLYQSNYWYNDGLKKAQIRDMSGAIVSLRRSLQYNRENIAARNLLGLVYAKAPLQAGKSFVIACCRLASISSGSLCSYW